MTELPTIVRMITWLPVGGIERRLVSILPRLREKGWPVRLILLREEGPLAAELKEKGVPVELIALKSRLDPFGIRRLSRRLKELDAKLVHAHMYRSSVPGTIAAHFAKVPVVFSQVHNVDTWESSRQAAMDRRLARWRTGTLCVSKAVQKNVCDTLRLVPESAPVLYNGCDTNLFRPDENLRAATRAELGLSDADIAVLVPARLHANKHPLGVLKAFLEARDATKANATLLYAGGGGMEAELRAAIDTAGAGDSVRLLGRRDDMPALYNAADAVLLSSAKEGFSNAVVEALACGKPVIAADVGGNREAIDSGRVGWIHASADHAAMVRQIGEAIGDPGALRARAGACRERGLVFSLDQLVADTDALYRSALTGAGVLPS